MEDKNPKSQPLSTHVILKVKELSDGHLDCFRARVVAGARFQVYGAKYMETHAPEVVFTVVRVFLYILLW